MGKFCCKLQRSDISGYREMWSDVVPIYQNPWVKHQGGERKMKEQV